MFMSPWWISLPRRLRSAARSLSPAYFRLTGPKTLIGGISLAGGLKDTASRNITLLRPATGQTYVINLGDDPKTALAANIPLFKGDTVIVGVAGVVYVVGAVKNSGVYRLKSSSATTLRQAIAMAGGTGYEAKLNKTVIIRNDDGRQTEIPFPINKNVSKPLMTSPWSLTISFTFPPALPRLR